MEHFGTRANQELLLKFFLSFAKFEYALKATGYFVPEREKPGHPPAAKSHGDSARRREKPEHTPAKPDWKRFVGELWEKFKTCENSDLTRAGQYLLDSPPNEQVISKKKLAWETPVRDQPESQSEPESDFKFVLRMVKVVRNNLFHGGKYSNEVHESTERTEQLLRSSLDVLNKCLELDPDLKAAYTQAEL